MPGSTSLAQAPIWIQQCGQLAFQQGPTLELQSVIPFFTAGLEAVPLRQAQMHAWQLSHARCMAIALLEQQPSTVGTSTCLAAVCSGPNSMDSVALAEVQKW